MVMLTNAKVEEITENGVVYEKDKKQTVEANSVVLAMDSKPNIGLKEGP